MYSQVETESINALRATAVDGDVRVTTETGSLTLPAIWLRDTCPCADCRDSTSGQRLFNIVDLPAKISVVDAAVVEDKVEVVFDDDHCATFDLVNQLAANGTAGLDLRNEEPKRLWARATDVEPIPRVNWEDYQHNPVPALKDVAEIGFVLVTGVPAQEKMVTEVAEVFGFVRETNYGRIFDVRIEENAINLAYTPLPISPHTDNPYRDPVPTLQLLHCIANAAEGGESGLVDGFAAAALLRDADPEAFATLTTIRVGYRFDSADASLHSVMPLIGLDSEGNIREVRFNNRSMIVPRLAPERAQRFYDSYRKFAELVYAPQAQLNFRLDPGDCLIFDNTRLLHARTAFAAMGGRHLQGTYADLDGLLSSCRLSERQS